MRDYIKVWNELGLTFDGLYCGFLGNEEQIDIVRGFVEMFRPPLFLLDPVMGDHGGVLSIHRDACSEDEGAAASGGYYHAEYYGSLPADWDFLEGWGMDIGAVGLCRTAWLTFVKQLPYPDKGLHGHLLPMWF